MQKIITSLYDDCLATEDSNHDPEFPVNFSIYAEYAQYFPLFPPWSFPGSFLSKSCSFLNTALSKSL